MTAMPVNKRARRPAITIQVAGPLHSGKTTIAGEIMALLEQHGFDVTLQDYRDRAPKAWPVEDRIAALKKKKLKVTVRVLQYGRRPWSTLPKET